MLFNLCCSYIIVQLVLFVHRCPICVVHTSLSNQCCSNTLVHSLLFVYYPPTAVEFFIVQFIIPSQTPCSAATVGLKTNSGDIICGIQLTNQLILIIPKSIFHSSIGILYFNILCSVHPDDAADGRGEECSVWNQVGSAYFCSHHHHHHRHHHLHQFNVQSPY